MAYIVPTRAETLDDRELYTQGNLSDVTCRQCQAQVMVRKNSEHHTSIQWTREAVETCAVFSELDQQDDGRPVHSACPQLLASIEYAVSEGMVTVGAGVDPVGLDRDRNSHE
ncbi:hypothetical protein [Aeromicrobium sp. 9AM]|uniref:hypothetical protein n=1 Tax=Aeromicrobium sp. 9AM TaxID=2653126 RepID=UPI0012EF6FD5|nr:hypothetical protein [Aeromicrobium sp. 9AM]VXC26105.1 conserved hypothetical protein [Aeromicrobium sp. 9AM]